MCVVRKLINYSYLVYLILDKKIYRDRTRVEALDEWRTRYGKERFIWECNI